jgi:hypothetical protein
MTQPSTDLSQSFSRNLVNLSTSHQFINQNGRASSYYNTHFWSHIALSIGSWLGLCESVAQRCAKLSIEGLLSRKGISPSEQFELSQGLVELMDSKSTVINKTTRSIAREAADRVRELSRSALLRFHYIELEKPLENRSSASMNYSDILPLIETDPSMSNDINLLTQLRLRTGKNIDHLQNNLPQIIQDLDIESSKSSQVSNRTMKVRLIKCTNNQAIRADVDLTQLGKAQLLINKKQIENNKKDFLKTLTDQGYPNASISEKNYSYVKELSYGPNVERAYYGSCWQLDIPNLGSITIPTLKALEKRITFEAIDSKSFEASKKLSIMMTLIGLSEATYQSENKISENSLKLMTLYRSFYPSKAAVIEKSGLILTPDLLRKAIIKAEPAMEAIFKEYKEGDLLELTDITPGQRVFTVPDMGKRIRDNGGKALMAGVRGVDTLCLMLRTGALSSKARFEAGIFVTGASSMADHRTGGAGYVFTRMITKEHTHRITNFAFAGSYQILFSLNTLNTASTAYGYSDDYYGTKTDSRYAKRDNLIEFTKKLARQAKSSHSVRNNEVMVKDRIPSHQIKGVIVQHESDAEAVKARLKNDGMVNKDNLVNGVPLDKFVQIAQKCSEIDSTYC